MSKELKSGAFEILRARCSQCGDAIGRHPYCADCGRPQRCGDAEGWTHDPATPEILRCPVCLRYGAA
jgi:hypothetical protein